MATVEEKQTCPNCLTNTFVVRTETSLPDGRIKWSTDCPYCYFNFGIGFRAADPRTEEGNDADK